jgi:uncharacterized membrane protein
MFALFSLPNPLHPALVHFPIVLLLLGAVVAIVAVFTRRWHLPIAAAILFVTGAIGTIVAVQTGEREGELTNETPALEQALDQHEAWAERTQVAAIVAGLLALAAVVTTRWPLVARGLGIATAAGALAASWGVIETGHYGGHLVYSHAAGINVAPADATGSLTDNTTVKGKKNHRDNDD